MHIKTIRHKCAALIGAATGTKNTLPRLVRLNPNDLIEAPSIFTRRPAVAFIWRPVIAPRERHGGGQVGVVDDQARGHPRT